MYIGRTSSAAAAAAARLRLDLAPVDVLHPLLVVRGLHEECASEAFFASPLCPLGCNGPRFARAGLLPCARNKDGQGR